MVGGDVDDLGGVTVDTRKHEVLSGDWAVPGLARLGLGEGGGDLEPRTGVATTSAAPGPAVIMASATAAWSGNSLVASLDPQTLKVSRQSYRSKMTVAVYLKLAPTNPS